MQEAGVQELSHAGDSGGGEVGEDTGPNATEHCCSM